MEIRFVFKSSSGKPRVHRKRLPVIVGRCESEEVRLRIPIDSVSRKHCEFYLDEDGTVCVRDLESTNGTLLNGKSLDPQAAAVVTPGSSVKVGTVVFRVDFKVSKNDPDGDTVSVSKALEPVSSAKTPTEPLPPEGSMEPVELDVEMDDDSEEMPAGDAFGFLEAAGSESSEDDPEEAESDEPSAASDENLEDFFKGLK